MPQLLNHHPYRLRQSKCYIQSDGQTIEDVLSSIVNPAKLSPELRDDVCYQCHLQPTSKLTSFATRFGRDIYSYRPGEPLDEYQVHFDFDDGRNVKDRFQINHPAHGN